MLPVNIANSMVAEFEKTIELLGSPVTWRQTKPPETVRSMTAGVRIVGRNDVEVINAIGIGGRIITARHADFDGDQPEKFDVFQLAGKLYVANSVHEVWLNEILVGWKIMARAKQ